MEIAQFLLTLSIILIAAKFMAELAQLIGQPAVLGELLAGVLIGPFALGLLPNADVFHHNEMFYILAEIGVLLLLFEIGLATDLYELLKVGWNSMLVAIIGVIVPFAAGYLFCHLIGETSIVSIVIGAALTATSIGITSKVFAELGYLQQKEAQIVIGAAVIDDIIGLAILAVVSTMATTHKEITPEFILGIVGVAVGFLVAAIFLGKIFVKYLIKVLEKTKSRGIMVTSALAFAFLMALLADYCGSSIIIGAFAAGILLAETHKKEVIEQGLKPIVDLFTPIFFVSVGIAVNIHIFNPFNAKNQEMILLTLALIAIAILGKFITGYCVVSKTKVDRVTIGFGMVPRGEVGLIFAAMGKSAKVLSHELYACIVAVVVISTLVVPPLLQWSIKKYQKNQPSKPPEHLEENPTECTQEY